VRIDILTLFPEMFPPVLGSSIVARAIGRGCLQVKVHNLRDWSQDKHRKVDDRPYGGGPGMVMRPEPFFSAVEEIRKQGYQVPKAGSVPGTDVPHVVLLSPAGERLTQAKVEKLAASPWLALLCGHYEGVDERVREGLADEELSIGDYVLTCGELPAMVVVDSVARLLPGALGDEQSGAQESFTGSLLEYPQYTRPVEFRGMRVPDVLLSGNVREIARWRKLQALRRTHLRRPDLLKREGSDGPSDPGD